MRGRERERRALVQREATNAKRSELRRKTKEERRGKKRRRVTQEDRERERRLRWRRCGRKGYETTAREPGEDGTERVFAGVVILLYSGVCPRAFRPLFFLAFGPTRGGTAAPRPRGLLQIAVRGARIPRDFLAPMNPLDETRSPRITRGRRERAREIQRNSRAENRRRTRFEIYLKLGRMWGVLQICLHATGKIFIRTKENLSETKR